LSLDLKAKEIKKYAILDLMVIIAELLRMCFNTYKKEKKLDLSIRKSQYPAFRVRKRHKIKRRDFALSLISFLFFYIRIEDDRLGLFYFPFSFLLVTRVKATSSTSNISKAISIS